MNKQKLKKEASELVRHIMKLNLFSHEATDCIVGLAESHASYVNKELIDALIVAKRYIVCPVGMDIEDFYTEVREPIEQALTKAGVHMEESA